jgi:hypothetical protein
MYVVAVHLVETLTGIWMGDFLQQRIWEPLNMKDTYWGQDDVEEHRASNKLSKCYRWDEDKSTHVEMPWPKQPEGAGAGEMKTTAVDYAKFLRCMIKKSQPLSEKAHEELVKPRIISHYPGEYPGEEPRPFHSHTLYALGWEVETYHGETVIGHEGLTTGYACKMLYLPERNWGFVTFANSSAAAMALGKICWTMIDDLLNIPAEKRFDWDAQWKQYEKEPECKTKEELYPKLPETPIPLTLPLYSYAGSYKDEGYGTLVVEYKDGKLQVDCTDRTWQFTLSLEHVSGEYLIAEMTDVADLTKRTMRAQFRLDAEGVVREFGVAFVDDIGDELIWFQRLNKGDENMRKE